MDDLDRELTNLLGDGRMGIADAAAVQAFAQFLTETPKGVHPNLQGQSAAEVVRCFPDAESFKAWRIRWLPFLAGLADGPTTAEEYAALIPALKELKR